MSSSPTPPDSGEEAGHRLLVLGTKSLQPCSGHRAFPTETSLCLLSPVLFSFGLQKSTTSKITAVVLGAQEEQSLSLMLSCFRIRGSDFRPWANDPRQPFTCEQSKGLPEVTQKLSRVEPTLPGLPPTLLVSKWGDAISQSLLFPLPSWVPIPSLVSPAILWS